MIDILFLLDFEPGHIFPVFKMAHNLEDAGNRVAFLGIADVTKYAEAEGFETHVIFDQDFSKKVLDSMEKKSDQKNGNEDISLLLSGALDDVIVKLNPKLILISDFMHLEALIIHYKYELPVMFYCSIIHDENRFAEIPNFSYPVLNSQLCLAKIQQLSMDATMELLDFFDKKNLQFNSYQKVVEPILNFPHLIICPEELKINKRPLHPQEIHIGPGVRASAKNEATWLKSNLPQDQNKSIVFASMGSMSRRFPKEATEFLKLVVEAMKDQQLMNFHLVLSTGGVMNESDFDDLPANVTMHDWIPQIALLAHVDVAIIHGGLGSLKECVQAGVPMMAIPMGLDQFINAERICHHALGIQIKERPLTKEKIVEGILQLKNDPEIQNGIQAMQNIFYKAETTQKEVQFIQTYLALKTQHHHV